jgi:hypothetical protein
MARDRRFEKADALRRIWGHAAESQGTASRANEKLVHRVAPGRGPLPRRREDG